MRSSLRRFEEWDEISSAILWFSRQFEEKNLKIERFSLFITHSVDACILNWQNLETSHQSCCWKKESRSQDKKVFASAWVHAENAVQIVHKWIIDAGPNKMYHIENDRIKNNPEFNWDRRWESYSGLWVLQSLLSLPHPAPDHKTSLWIFKFIILIKSENMNLGEFQLTPRCKRLFLILSAVRLSHRHKTKCLKMKIELFSTRS